MRYSRVKRLYEVFGPKNMNFKEFCWYLYREGIITFNECVKFNKMEGEANEKE